jgi:hypothetical protein
MKATAILTAKTRLVNALLVYRRLCGGNPERGLQNSIGKTQIAAESALDSYGKLRYSSTGGITEKPVY